MLQVKKVISRENPYLFILALFLGVILAVGGSVWATTIGTNISSSGTLSATNQLTISASNSASSSIAYALGIATSTPGATFAVGGNGYLTGGLGVGKATTTAGALELTGPAYVAGALSVGGNISVPDGEVGASKTRATATTGSFQTIWGDLTYEGAAGSTSFYHAGVMGNFMGAALSNTNAVVHAGVIGKYSVTTSDGVVGAKAGLVGETETSVADAAIMAILGGDDSTLTPNAAYGVQYFNSTAASKFSYGLDLFHAETTGYVNSAVDYGTADIRLQNGETISNATDGVITLGGAALLNRIATSSPTTDTTLTAAQSGTTFFMGTAGLDLTLPAIANTNGVWYRFVVSTAVADTSQTVIAPTAILQGPIDVNSTMVLCTSETTITFAEGADVIGDWVEVRSDGTNWFVTGQAQATNGITCAGT
ncbi:MAG: hypothetical protein HYW91_00580 [Candidatus Sungbacteria bacterium]|nr:hypothetical protein [Candidatus Sungbacteria bacterium]